MIRLTAEAVELFAASWCNLDCAYCNIPKHNQMIKDKHQDIIRDILAVDPVIDKLKNLYGEKLKVISHWGSEPTLTLMHFKGFYEVAVKEFPNLDMVSMSSNFMTNPVIISKFILEDLPRDKPLKIRIQMSLDGEAWATEVNRGKGTTEKIQENIVSFIEQINSDYCLPHKVLVHFKPTMSKDQYEHLLENDNLHNHYLFFDELLKKMHSANINKKVSINNGCDPTAVCPDKYTKHDGIVLAKFYKEVLALAEKKLFKHVTPSFASYYSTMTRMNKFNNELFTKAKMFTCSAGDSQFGLSEYLHPCHDTFYLPYDEVQDAIRNDLGRINSTRELENLESGRTALAQKTLFVKVDGLTQESADRYQYLMRGFHDFMKFRLSYGVATILAMAKAGQVSECYKDVKMAEVLSMFASIRHSCLTGNVQYAGSIHLTDQAYFRLFGNGLVEMFLEKELS